VPKPRARERRGFTITEILIVVVLLGILAAITIPRLARATTDARSSAARSILRAVQSQIALHYAVNGEYPPTIDPQWFVEGKLPSNPFDPDNPISIRYSGGDPGRKHPGIKTTGDRGAFWYHTLNGCFRAYVLEQATDAETLQLYNEVNGCHLIALIQVRD